MSQIDGYVRIQTTNDTTPAQRSTERLGDTIADSMDTTPVDNMDSAINSIGDSALSTGNLLKANLLSDLIMNGLTQVAAAIKDISVAAVTTAMDNETAFAKVKTLLTGDDYEQYYNGLMEISNRTGVAFADLAESMYSALSASVAQDKVLEFVEGTVNLAKGGFTQAATAIDVVTSALNAYQLSADQATHIQDILIVTQNKGKTTVDELASNMGKVIPTAKSLNVQLEQLGAMYATVTANGVATAETTTYLNTMLNELGAAGSTAEKNLLAATQGTELQGKKFKELSEMGYDVTDVLQLISDYAQDAGLSLSDMFSSSEAGKAANILQSNITVFKANLDEMGNSAGAAAEAAATMAATTAEAVQIAKNQIDNMVTDVANSVIPIIAETAQQLSTAFNENKDEIKEVTTAIGELVGGGLTFLLKNIKLITSAISGATTGVIAFKAAAVITGVIKSWQTAALQIALFSSAQGAAALKTAALNGTLTAQEIVVATLSGKLDVTTAKTAALSAVQAMSPAGALAIAIGLLATALTGYALCTANATDETKEFADKTKHLKENIDDAIVSNEAEMTMLQKKAARYEELRSAIELTSDEKSELKGLAADLQNTLGDEVDVVDKLTGKYNDLTTAIDTYMIRRNTEVKKNAYEASATEAYANIMVLENKQKNEIEEAKSFLDRQSEAYKIDWREFYDDDTYDFGIYSNEEFFLNATKPYADKVKAYEKVIAENQAIIDEWEKIEKDFLTNYSDFNGTSNGTSPVATIDNSSLNADIQKYYEKSVETFKQLRKDIDYFYDMGETDAAAYYAKLSTLCDKYLEEDSDEWRSVQKELKKYRDKLTEDQQKAYDEQVKAAEEAAKAEAKAAEDAYKSKVEAFNNEKSLLQFRLRTGKITEKQYYTELAKIRDKYLDKNSEEWRNAFLETYDYNQRIISENKSTLQQLLSDTADETLSALENITAARDSLTKKLIDFNKTFEKISETIPETIAVKGAYKVTTAEHEIETYKMGADGIEDNIKVLEDYGAMLDALKARGADDSTMSNILAMDIDEAMKFGAEMLALSDDEWQKYFDSMAKLRATASEISAKYYQSEIDTLKTGFVDKLRDELDGLGSDMYKVGADAVAEFIKGWNEAMGTKDLTVGQIMSALTTGTLETAPTAAQQTASADNMPATKMALGGVTKLDIFLGGTKFADILIDTINQRIIQNGKNVLKT